MDDFPLDRPELNGSLITLEFGGGGRIHQMWVADPGQPEDAQEYQFVLPSITFGEEFSEDYFPGTILLGARTRPDDPWILDRSKVASSVEEEEYGRTASFQYDFALLAELQVTGKFYELPQPIPQIVWEVRVENRGRVSVEIGELAFPLAYNNLYEGPFGPDERKSTLLGDRMRLHLFIGGDASYLFAQRMSGEPPGLLAFPGDGTSWELWTSVPASLNTSFHWGGIPVVYVFCKAAVEREGWGDSVGAASSLVLEPGDSQVFQTRFVATGAEGHDAALHTLAACGRPAIKLLPSAVAPRDVGIAVETGGTSPSRFSSSSKADLEADSDDLGGFCFVRPKSSGPLKLSFVDANGRSSNTQLLFVEPIESLIQARASFIASRQVSDAPGSAFHKAILPVNLRTMTLINLADSLGSSFAVESSLADAAFLAEKNASYPDASQMEVLDQYVREFVLDDLQNPADGAVGSSFVDADSVAVHHGNPRVYSLLWNLYLSLSRACRLGKRESDQSTRYLQLAFQTAQAMFRNAVCAVSPQGIPCISQIERLLDELGVAGLEEERSDLATRHKAYARHVAMWAAKMGTEWAWNPTMYEEIFWAAQLNDDPDLISKVYLRANAQRGLCPSWWSYGSDQYIPHESFGTGQTPFADRGVLTLGHTCPAISSFFFQLSRSDLDSSTDGFMRAAFGGMLAPWAMVRPDGAASMGFCADPASKQHGASVWSGSIGIALLTYLREAASWVLPSRTIGLFTFGCHFESDGGSYAVRPWDGVGRRVVLRQIGFEAECRFGRIIRVSLDIRKRWAVFEIENPADIAVSSAIRARGLWGRNFDVGGKSVQSVNGELAIDFDLPPKGKTLVEVRSVKP